MKNNKSVPYLILSILFILFNVIAFAIPTEKTAAFWIVYAFTILMFAAQILIWKISSEKTETLNSMFLKIPIVYVGTIFLIIQLIAFVVFMVFPMIPMWVAIIVCAVILCLGAICIITTKTAVEEVQRVEEKVARKVFYIKDLQIDVELMAKAESDPTIKKSLEKLAEKIRFSDPMSSEVLSELETTIQMAVKTLKTSSNKLDEIKEIELLIEERNAKCIILKD